MSWLYIRLVCLLVAVSTLIDTPLMYYSIYTQHRNGSSTSRNFDVSSEGPSSWLRLFALNCMHCRHRQYQQVSSNYYNIYTHLNNLFENVPTFVQLEQIQVKKRQRSHKDEQRCLSYIHFLQVFLRNTNPRKK